MNILVDMLRQEEIVLHSHIVRMILADNVLEVDMYKELAIKRINGISNIKSSLIGCEYGKRNVWPSGSHEE